jgi:hypothetical protein
MNTCSTLTRAVDTVCLHVHQNDQSRFHLTALDQPLLPSYGIQAEVGGTKDHWNYGLAFAVETLSSYANFKDQLRYDHATCSQEESVSNSTQRRVGRPSILRGIPGTYPTLQSQFSLDPATCSRRGPRNPTNGPAA